jgi:RNA polymerase sigma factor (sigma-70 family)
LTEQELIHKLRLKDEPAFRWLVRHYRNRVYSTVLNILQNSEDSEDAAQETFIQVFESIGTFKEASSLTTWIYRIAIRKALDKRRKKKLLKKIQDVLPWWMPKEAKREDNDFHHPGVLVENKEKGVVLFKAMAKLPEKQQLAFSLIRVQGINYEEAAEIMQLSVKAIESLVSRGKANLQKELEYYYKNIKMP